MWPLRIDVGLDFHKEPPALFTCPSEDGEASICDQKGNLLFYSGYVNGESCLVKLDGSIVSGSEGIDMARGATRRSIIIPVPGHLQQYYYFSFHEELNANQIPEFYSSYSIVDLKNDMNVILKNQKLAQLLCYKDVANGAGVTAAANANGKDVWLIMRDQDTFLSFDITAKGIGRPVKSYQPLPMHFDTIDKRCLTASFNSHILAETSNGRHRHSSSVSDIADLFSSICVYSIDPVTGVISNQKVLDYDFQAYARSGLERNYEELCFSPHDSFLYVPVWGRNNIIYQFDMNAADIPASKYALTYKNENNFTIQLADNGKIYIGGLDYSSKDAIDVLSLIKYPDRKGVDCGYTDRYYKFSAYFVGFFFPNIFRPHFLNLKFTYSPICGGLQFTANADTAFNSFTWFFDNGDSVVGQVGAHQFPAPGKYFVKVRGSTSNGYSAWYSDTVTYNPLPRPQAHYRFATQRGCQWVGFQFNDSSACDSSRMAYRSWLWSFGDGKSDTARNPKHVYVQPGQYRVSLAFSDCICTDTFSSLQDIVIIPAPEPGFVLSGKQGCSPFTEKVTEHSAGAVQHRLYTSGSGDADTTDGPVFIYHKPGNYIIHQYLKGPTGCVTEDSQSIRVIQPFENTDGLRLLQVSVDTQGLFLKWKPYAHVQAYNIFRKDDRLDWLFLGQVSDTMYRDHEADYTRNHYQYYIQVVDSCNNESPGTVSGNILLQAVYTGRQKIQLNWNDYTGWRNGVGRYELERKTDSFGRYTVINTSTNTGMTDDGMGLTGQTNSCYRVHAFEQGGNHRESYSNETCIRIQPLFWAPNAFTPNGTGPGANETFKVIGCGLRNFELQVMTKNWNVVYDSHDINQGWDGTFKGHPMPEGEYMYVINALSEDGFIHNVGCVDLIR